MKSKTGADWTEAPPIKGVNLNSIAYGNGAYVAAGESGIFTSSDAVSWRRQDSGGSKWNRVRYVEGTFLAFGEVPNPAGQTFLQVGLSTNGFDWRVVQSNQFSYDVVNITTDGKALFAITGSSEAAGTRYFKSIWRSLDRQAWIEVYRDSEQKPSFLAFGNGVFVALGGSGSGSKRVLLSPDGTKWTAYDGLSIPETVDLIFVRGKFYASDSQRIFSSSDGRNWSASSTGYLRPLRELSAGPQGLFATSIGSIFHAPWDLTLSQPRRLGRSGVVFDIHGTPGQQVLIETASSLAPATWKPLSTNELAGSSLQILDTEAGDAPQRFYRASAR